MKGTSLLRVLANEKVKFKGISSLRVDKRPMCYLSAQGSLFILQNRYGRLDLKIPSISAKLSNKAFGAMTLTMAPAKVDMETSFKPPVSHSIDVWFPAIAFSGRLVKLRQGAIQADFSNILMQGGSSNSNTIGQNNYGVVSVKIATPEFLAYDDPDPLLCSGFTLAGLKSSVSRTCSYLTSINAKGAFADTGKLTKEILMSLMEIISTLDSFNISGQYILTINNLAIASTNSILRIGDSNGFRPAIEENVRTWSINLDTGATSQYDDYGFNSFFESNGKAYGVADDGIYLLEGDTDAGSPIRSTVDFGSTRLNTSSLKTLHNVYLGVGSSGAVYLKIDANGVSYTYKARSNSEYIKNHRVDTGRGLRGNYFNFSLVSEGEDYDLETISYELLELSRKI